MRTRAVHCSRPSSSSQASIVQLPIGVSSRVTLSNSNRRCLRTTTPRYQQQPRGLRIATLAGWAIATDGPRGAPQGLEQIPCGRCRTPPARRPRRRPPSPLPSRSSARRPRRSRSRRVRSAASSSSMTGGGAGPPVHRDEAGSPPVRDGALARAAGRGADVVPTRSDPGDACQPAQLGVPPRTIPCRRPSTPGPAGSMMDRPPTAPLASRPDQRPCRRAMHSSSLEDRAP